MSLSDEAEHEQLMRRKHELELDMLKQDYRDSRTHQNVEQERKDIESRYTLSMHQADDIHREQTRLTEGKRAGIRVEKQSNPRSRYYLDEFVANSMERLFDTVNSEHNKAKNRFGNERARMLRALDEGIDPLRIMEYERKKNSLETHERARLATILSLSRIEDEMKYEEEARVRRRQCPQNNPPWEMGCSHGNGF